MQKSGVCILGIFAADTVYTSARMPQVAETILGSGFKLGPGGKGSNQAVAAAKAGAKVNFISRIGNDAFGDLALKTWLEAGVEPKLERLDGQSTGAAFIYVNENNGDNAIIVVPGAAATISVADVEKNRAAIESASVFITQLEQPLEAAIRGLEIARDAGVTTVFNPAPAKSIPDSVYQLCDYVVPNEVEASILTGVPVSKDIGAAKAAEALLAKGAKAAIITLGSSGVLLHTDSDSIHVPARSIGRVVDTTGAGDAFLGGFAAALSSGLSPLEAIQFGTVTAGIAVTRHGTAQAMPTKNEINQFLYPGDSIQSEDRGQVVGQ